MASKVVYVNNTLIKGDSAKRNVNLNIGFEVREIRLIHVSVTSNIDADNKATFANIKIETDLISDKEVYCCSTYGGFACGLDIGFKPKSTNIYGTYNLWFKKYDGTDFTISGDDDYLSLSLGLEFIGK
mgnify:CR=1 FL=1